MAKLPKGSFEPSAEEFASELAADPRSKNEDMGIAIFTSIAISLKRIADAAERMIPADIHVEDNVPL